MVQEIAHAYFIGDVHLDVRRPEREAAFCNLLDSVRKEKPDHVFLMGDLFEFWFGYSRIMFSGHLKAVLKIAQLSEAGIPVTYLVGNHDFRPGPVFRDILGVHVAFHPLRVHIGSHFAYVSHGDEINTADRKYRLIRGLLRNPVTQTLFRCCVPPSVAWYIGRGTSHSSRRINARRERPIPEEIFRSFVSREAANGIDIVIHGHNHDPGMRTVTAGGRPVTIIDSGDWLGGRGHYVAFSDDTFRCRTWPI